MSEKHVARAESPDAATPVAKEASELDADEPHTPLWFSLVGMSVFLLGAGYVAATAEPPPPREIPPEPAPVVAPTPPPQPAAAQPAPPPGSGG